MIDTEISGENNDDADTYCYVSRCCIFFLIDWFWQHKYNTKKKLTNCTLYIVYM